VTVLVIDGMGGGIGKALVEKLVPLKAHRDLTLVAVGTNAIATTAMLKAGADIGATGENAVLYNAARLTGTDGIVGVLGIAFANAMHGEISPKMAEAVSLSPAQKILLPLDKGCVTLTGLAAKPLQDNLNELVSLLAGLADTRK